jgi:hypothetical protein
MLNEERMRVKYIVADTWPEHEKAYNDFLDEIDGKKIVESTKPERNNKGEIVVTITYIEEVNVRESIVDDFHEEGIRYVCAQCPYCEDPHDKRRKWCKCKFKRIGRTRRDSEVCRYFYALLAAGEVDLVEE